MPIFVHKTKSSIQKLESKLKIEITQKLNSLTSSRILERL